MDTPSFFSPNPLATPVAAAAAENSATQKEGNVQTPDDEKMTDVPGTSDIPSDRHSFIRKRRSVSDVSHSTPSRSSTPISAQQQRLGKDDISIGAAPATPQRRGHGLALQMPARLGGSNLSAASPLSRAPLSPKLDPSNIYGSPASVLPRRSRGLDFSRASTNLHHSTLAEASPDSSPSVFGRGVSIPQRKSAALGSPNNTHCFWSGSGHVERTNISSSMSSVNMLDSDSSDSSDDDEESLPAFDRGDPMVMTPQASRTGNPLSTAFSPSVNQSVSGEWLHGMSSAKASLIDFQRARIQKSAHSSSSTSSKPSPVPTSSPVLKGVETLGGGYFPKDPAALEEIKTRRESLSLGTNDLHLSDFSDEGENKQTGISSPSSGSLASGSNTDTGRRGVVKRPVTRRGNLLPKTKNFARIRAALFEESTPIESEAKREAEVIRQVRESDAPVRSPPPLLMSNANNPVSSALGGAGTSATSGGCSGAFGFQTSGQLGRSDFWNGLDSRYQTPPPTSQNIDANLKESLAEICGSSQMPRETPHSGASTPFTAASQADVGAGQTKLNKRRRNDDLDLASFKRRAVSPAMSAQSSPILPHASVQVPKSVIHPNPMNEGGPHTGHVKRVGLQGMNETNDGLMRMSID
ncbi:hypothetical protein VTO42DRAFT_8189 [Malbranchea cinnamomea]